MYRDQHEDGLFGGTPFGGQMQGQFSLGVVGMTRGGRIRGDESGDDLVWSAATDGKVQWQVSPLSPFRNGIGMYFE
jgi:hypothetical protein